MSSAPQPDSRTPNWLRRTWVSEPGAWALPRLQRPRGARRIGLAVVLLSVLDLVATLVHLRAGGEELNPLMAQTLDWGGELGFVLLKLATTALGVGLLGYLSWDRRAFLALRLSLAFYLLLGLWHLVVAADRIWVA